MAKTTEELYRELLAKGDAAQQQADDLLSQINNRDPFSYNLDADGTWKALQNQYVHQGRRAMEDTMGQAAGLTGGYISTYSQGVGNQAYNEWLNNLNAQIPGLVKDARAAYDAEGDRMLDRYNLALNAASNAYGQGRDALGDLRYEQETAYNQQQDAYSRERQAQLDAQDKAYQDWQMARANQSDARDYAMMLIQMGQMPSDTVLQAAGYDKADIQKMISYYSNMLAMQSAGGSGGGGGRSGGSGSGSGSRSGTGGSGTQLSTYDNLRQSLYAAARNNNQGQAYQIMEQYAGKLSPAEQEELVKLYDMLFNRNATNGAGGSVGNIKPGTTSVIAPK